jgi:hypothetical protein
LNPISGSTSSEEVAEIRSRLDEMANEDDYFDQEEIIEKQDAAIRAGDYFEEQSNVSDSSVENHVSSIDESLENIGDAWNTIKNESEAVSERSKILRDKMPEDRASDSE